MAQDEEAESTRSEAQLLAAALEHLAAADRQRVTAWLLDRVPRRAGWFGAMAGRSAAKQSPDWPAAMALLHGSTDRAMRELLANQLATSGALAGGYQVVPVRLPAELHTRLRDWCTEHGFSMATVVRGLVTRFLDGQTEAD